jgi:hypothetical protein
MIRRTLLRRALLTRQQHPQSAEIVRAVISSPAHLRRDAAVQVFDALNGVTFLVTYGIIVNWLYNGHLDMWDGVYGIEDEDDDDDD